jgi:Galactose oxidase, central domain
MKPSLAVISALSILTCAQGQLGVWENPQPSSSPPWRAGEGLAFEPWSGTFVAYGGQGAGGAVLNDTHAFDGCGWTQHFPVTDPGPLTNIYLSASPSLFSVVLFGGNSGVPFAPLSGATWEYNTGTGVWSNLTPPGASPSPRELANMAYDSARGRTVLFGGGNAVTGVFASDTWEWDGVNWFNVTPAGVSPPGRAWHAMAYDSARARTVIYGGYNGSQLGDTWEWDGLQWTQVFPAASPGGRSSGAMAYDPWSQRIVLFAGSVGWPIGLNDTWEYDGVSWSAVTLFGGPPPLTYLHRMAGDPIRGGVIFYGAYTNNWAPSIDTWRYRRAALTASTTAPPVGTSVTFTLSVPTEPGFPYLAAISGTGACPGVLLPDGRIAPITVDAYTLVALSGQLPTIFQAFSGTLTASGTANPVLNIPPYPPIIGLALTTAAVTATGAGISTVSNPIRIVLQ